MLTRGEGATMRGLVALWSRRRPFAIELLHRNFNCWQHHLWTACMVHGAKLRSMQGTKRCAAQMQNSAGQQWCTTMHGAQHKRHKIVDWCTVYSNMHCAAQNRVHGAHVLLSCRAASTGNQEGNRELSSGTTQSINDLKTLHSSTEVQRKNHCCAAHFEAEKWLKWVCVKNSWWPAQEKRK